MWLSLCACLCAAVAVTWGHPAPFDSSDLPAEHRLPVNDLVLPDTTHIPGQRLGEWQIDKFFSLWYIFGFSDNVEVSDKPYTVIAPSNDAFSGLQLESGPAGRGRIVNILRNHILLGQLVTQAQLKALEEGAMLQLTTLLGTTAVFTKKNGQLYVNDTEIEGDVIEITNASIVRTAGYLPLPDPLPNPEFTEPPPDGSGAPAADLSEQASDEADTLLLLNEVGELPDTGPQLDPSITGDNIEADFASDNQRVKIPAAGSDSFVEAVQDALSLLRSGVGEFQGYFYDANVTSMFSDDKEYTLFLPVNEAFQRFYPIDWGFNPFLVKDFTRETVINHFVPGRITTKDITSGMTVKTMGGKELKFEKLPETILVNDKPIFLGDTPVSHGNILFLDDLLFVDYNVVAELNKKHKDKETAPVLAGLAGEAPFLAHLIGQLTYRDNSGSDGGATFNKFISYLYKGFQQISKSVSNDQTYTFLALDDTAVRRALDGVSRDPLLLDAEFRTEMLLGHLIPERLYQHDLKDGFTALTLAGKLIKVHVKDGVTYMNGARVEPRQEHVYNLGNVFFLDSFPLVSREQLVQRAAALPEDAEVEGSGGEDPSLDGVESFGGELGLPDEVANVDILTLLSRTSP